MEQANQILKTYKIPVALSLVGLVLIIGGVFTSGLLKPTNFSKTNLPKQSIVSADGITQIKVDISGAIRTPGVLSLASNSRVDDVIKAAGGFSNQANLDYVSKHINLSQKVTDGNKIYIPFEGEQLAVVATSVNNVQQQGGKIGINSATSSELDTLPGIGPTTAGKIIAGRPYSDISDLQSKKIVTNSVFIKIKDLIDTN